MQQDSIFTRIVKGEIPSYKVYEDDNLLAFLDIHPVQPGHTLVITKKQVEFLWDLDDSDYEELMRGVKKIARHMRQVLPGKLIGVQVMGIDVPHVHVHLIPFSTTEEFRNRPDMNAVPDHKSLEQMAKKLAF